MDGDGQVDVLGVGILGTALHMEQESLIFVNLLPPLLLEGESGQCRIIDEDDLILFLIGGTVPS